MAIGDIQDIYNRFIAQLPPWFGNSHPVLDQLINGYASISSFIYNQQYLYVLAQTRIQTASGSNLDLIAQDYYGFTLTRNPNEPDDGFRNRITASLLQQQCTEPGIFNIIWRFTGHPPSIFDSNNTNNGYYNVPSTLGYNIEGNYGGDFTFSGTIVAYVSADQSMGGFGCYNVTNCGYNVATTLWYGGESLDTGLILIEDLIELVDAIIVFGTEVNVVIAYTNADKTFPPGIFI